MKCDLNSNTCNVPTGTQIQCKLDGEKLAFLMSTKGELLIDWLQEKEANPLPEVNPALAGKVQDPGGVRERDFSRVYTKV